MISLPRCLAELPLIPASSEDPQATSALPAGLPFPPAYLKSDASWGNVLVMPIFPRTLVYSHPCSLETGWFPAGLPPIWTSSSLGSLLSPSVLSLRPRQGCLEWPWGLVSWSGGTVSSAAAPARIYGLRPSCSLPVRPGAGF